MKIMVDYRPSTKLIRFYNHEGYIHRADGPAKVWWDGECYWYTNGKFGKDFAS